MLWHDRDVIYKLLGFTLAMIALPIGSYFATVNTVFGGELRPDSSVSWEQCN
jgi:VMA21-like domain